MIPWADDPGMPDTQTDRSFSYMKNRWVEITKDGKTCYGQIQDAGPGQYNDAEYVFGSDDPRPKNSNFNAAGMDVSPAVNGCLGFADLNGEDDLVDWHFVDESMSRRALADRGDHQSGHSVSGSLHRRSPGRAHHSTICARSAVSRSVAVRGDAGRQRPDVVPDQHQQGDHPRAGLRPDLSACNCSWMAASSSRVASTASCSRATLRGCAGAGSSR